MLIAQTVKENYAFMAMTRLIALLRRKYEQGRRSGLVLCTHSNYFCSFIQRNTISVSVKYIPKITSESTLLTKARSYRFTPFKLRRIFARSLLTNSCLRNSISRVMSEQAIALLRGPRLQTLKNTSFSPVRFACELKFFFLCF
jgi:hypothetical protein